MPNNFPELSQTLFQALFSAEIDAFKAQTFKQLEKDCLSYFDYQVFKKYFSNKANKTRNEKLLMALFYKEKENKNYSRYQHYSPRSLNQSAELLNKIYVWFDFSYNEVSNNKNKFSEEVLTELNNYFGKIQDFFEKECHTIKKSILKLDRNWQQTIKLPEIKKSKFLENSQTLKSNQLINLEKIRIENGNFIFVPKPIANYIKKPKPWYLFWLPSLDSLWNMMFGNEVSGLINQINNKFKQVHDNINTIFSETNLLNKSINFELLLENLHLVFDNNKKINELTIQASSAKPGWPLSWFASSANKALNKWVFSLEKNKKKLIELEIILLEKLSLVIEPLFLEELDKLEERSLFLDKIHNISFILNKMFQQLEKSKDPVLFNRFLKVYKHFKSTVNLSNTFIKMIADKDSLPLVNLPSQGITIKGVEPDKFKKMFYFYLANTDGKQAKAIEIISKLINSEKYPSFIEFQEAIKILHESSNNIFVPEELTKFIIRQYVLPKITGIEHAGYKFVESCYPSMIDDWLVIKRPEAEHASELLRNILFCNAGEEFLLAKEAKPILVNGLEISADIEIIKRAINIVKDFSSKKHDYTLELKQNLEQYLISYNGDNNNYSDLIQYVAVVLSDHNLVLNYAKKRILYLIKNQPENLATDPFLKMNHDNPAFQDLIKSTLTELCDSKSSDDLSCETFVKIKKYFGRDCLFSEGKFASKLKDADITLKSTQDIMQCFYNNDFTRAVNKIEFVVKNLNRYSENDMSYLSAKKILEATMSALTLWVKTLIFQDLNKVNNIKVYIVEPLLKQTVIDNPFFNELVWLSNNYHQLYKIYSDLFIFLNNIISGLPTEINFSTDFFSMIKNGFSQDKIKEIKFFLKKSRNNLPEKHPVSSMINALYDYLSFETGSRDLKNNFSGENFKFSLQEDDYVSKKDSSSVSKKADLLIKNLDSLMHDMDEFFNSKSCLQGKGKQKLYEDECPRHEAACC